MINKLVRHRGRADLRASPVERESRDSDGSLYYGPLHDQLLHPIVQCLLAHVAREVLGERAQCRLDGTRRQVWPSIPRQICRGECPGSRQLFLLHEVAGRRRRVRMWRGEQETPQRIHPAEVEEEQSFEIDRAHPHGEFV